MNRRISCLVAVCLLLGQLGIGACITPVRNMTARRSKSRASYSRWPGRTRTSTSSSERLTRAGRMQTWDIEANSLSILRPTDATPENLKVGDTIKVAGSPSRRAPNRMWAMNILAANGRKIVLGPGNQTALASRGQRLQFHVVRGRHGREQGGGPVSCVVKKLTTQVACGGGTTRSPTPRKSHARRSIPSPTPSRRGVARKACPRSWNSRIRWSS